MDLQGPTDLSPLSRMLSLRRLRFRLWGDRWLLSDKQFSDLALCAQLSSLDVGPLVPFVQWSAMERNVDGFPELGLMLTQLATLHADVRRVEDGSPSPRSLARYATKLLPQPSPLASAGNLTDLNLDCSMLSANVWPALLEKV